LKIIEIPPCSRHLTVARLTIPYGETTVTTPRKLGVDIALLIAAMQGMGGEEAHDFLDLRTGQLHLIDDQLLRAVEEGEVDDLPDWQGELAPIAEAVLAGDENLVEVPHTDSADAFELMRDFLDQVDDQAAQQALAQALSGPKPFRRFKDALFNFPGVREKWFAFQTQQAEATARRWLIDLGVEPIEPIQS
jgi:hypothetical protein